MNITVGQLFRHRTGHTWRVRAISVERGQPVVLLESGPSMLRESIDALEAHYERVERGADDDPDAMVFVLGEDALAGELRMQFTRRGMPRHVQLALAETAVRGWRLLEDEALRSESAADTSAVNRLASATGGSTPPAPTEGDSTQ